LQASGERRDICRRSVGVIALLSYIGVCLGFYISFAKFVLPRKLDYFLVNFDGSLGFQASVAAWKLVHASMPLHCSFRPWARTMRSPGSPCQRRPADAGAALRRSQRDAVFALCRRSANLLAVRAPETEPSPP
jgi:hypothetical protein